MKVTLEKINNAKVRPLKKVKPKDPRPIKGANLFEVMTGNIFMAAKTQSGKTCNIGYIIEETADKNTTIIIFCSTVYNCESWESILKYCEDEEIPFIVHQSMYNDEGKNEVEILLKDLEEEAKARKEEEQRQKEQRGRKRKEFPIILCDSDSDEEEDEKPKRKSKYRTPKYIVIFDDLADEIKCRCVANLLKKSRHYDMKVIISSQYYLDIAKGGRGQIYYYLVYGGFPEKTIDKIHEDSNVPISNELFYRLYRDATKEPYSFLYVSRTGEIRKNFERKYNIKED